MLSNKAFRYMIEVHLKQNMRFALMCRQQDQIRLARECLLRCAKDGDDPVAIMHLCFALESGGWGFSQQFLSSSDFWGDYLERAANNYANVCATLFLYWHDPEGRGHGQEYDKIHKKFDEIYDKADPVERLVLCYLDPSEEELTDDELEYFETCANNGNEYAQVLLAKIFCSKDYKKGIYWYTKAAEQGNYEAIKQLSYQYSARDPEESLLFERYNYKARIQENL